MVSDSRLGDARFPFSPSPFSERATSDRAQPRDLPAAGINEARIPEGRLRDGSSITYPISRMTENGLRIPDTLRNARQLASLRPGIRSTGLRLLPLASFAWGTPGASPRPRTNADHVLLWITAGEMSLAFPRAQRILPRDSVQYIPAGTAFSAFPGCNAEGIAIFISPSALKHPTPIFPNQPMAKAVGDHAAALAELVGEIGVEAEKHSPDFRALYRPLLALAMLLDNLEPARQT